MGKLYFLTNLKEKALPEVIALAAKITLSITGPIPSPLSRVAILATSPIMDDHHHFGFRSQHGCLSEHQIVVKANDQTHRNKSYPPNFLSPTKTLKFINSFDNSVAFCPVWSLQPAIIAGPVI